MGEISPGSVPRRWIPEGGIDKHRAKIHRESKFADEHKNLPFTFSKPDKPKKSDVFRCAKCGHLFTAPSRTIMCICSECKELTSVERLDA